MENWLIFQYPPYLAWGDGGVYTTRIDGTCVEAESIRALVGKSAGVDE